MLHRLHAAVLLSFTLICPGAAQNIAWLIDAEEAGNTRAVEGVWETTDGGMVMQQRNEFASAITRFSPDGVALWSNWYTVDAGSSLPGIDAIEVFPDGSSVIINRSTLTSIGAVLVVARIDGDGNVAWSRRITLSELWSTPRDFSIDRLSNGDLVIIGSEHPGVTCRLVISADGQVLVADRAPYGFEWPATELFVNDQDEVTLLVTNGQPPGYGEDAVVRWDASGQEVWSVNTRVINGLWQFGSSSGMAVDGQGDVYVSGQQKGPGFTNNDFPYMVKINSDGTLAWYRIYGTGNYTTGGSAPGRLLADGSLQFGLRRNNVFSTNGEHLDSYYIDLVSPPAPPDGPQWQDNWFRARGTDMFISGRRYREDPVFGFYWTWPFIYKGTLPEGDNCLWQRSQYALFAVDTLVPLDYLLFQSNPPLHRSP